MPRLLYAPLAIQDLEDIAAFIARDKPVAARKFVARIRDRCEFLARRPLLTPLRPTLAGGQLRSHIVGNYVIYFRATDRLVEIVRILHAARDHEALL